MMKLLHVLYGSFKAEYRFVRKYEKMMAKVLQVG